MGALTWTRLRTSRRDSGGVKALAAGPSTASLSAMLTCVLASQVAGSPLAWTGRSGSSTLLVLV